MPIDEAVSIANSLSGALFVKVFFILFLVFYLIFTIILFRQIDMMGRELPTNRVPFLKFLGRVHVGIALALIFLVLGVF